MMGERDPQKQLWSYQVNLDRRVRSDHPLRRINQALDLDFVRPEVAKFYGAKGNVSEDPVVIVKMMLLLFLDGVRSERELMRIIPERLDYMWFLGYGLDDTIPNHSVLSKARKLARLVFVFIGGMSDMRAGGFRQRKNVVAPGRREEFNVLSAPGKLTASTPRQQQTEST